MGGPATIEGSPHKHHPETDNFEHVKFVVGGVEYHSPENYFQCQKSVGVCEREFEATRQSGCGCDVWMAGMRVKLRPDWEAVKVRVMYDGNRAKFEQHPDRAARLVASGRGRIHFGASSAFWCYWNAKIMTLLREELRAEAERDNDLISQIWKEMDEYEANERRKMDANGGNDNNK